MGRCATSDWSIPLGAFILIHAFVNTEADCVVPKRAVTQPAWLCRLGQTR